MTVRELAEGTVVEMPLAYLDTDPDAIDEMSRKAFIYYNDLQKGKVQTK